MAKLGWWFYGNCYPNNLTCDKIILKLHYLKVNDKEIIHKENA